MTYVVKCRICGRRLTNPVSVKRGIGPVCATKVKKETMYERYEHYKLDEVNGWQRFTNQEI